MPVPALLISGSMSPTSGVRPTSAAASLVVSFCMAVKVSEAVFRSSLEAVASLRFEFEFNPGCGMFHGVYNAADLGAGEKQLAFNAHFQC